jgi:hypothetical protein
LYKRIETPLGARPYLCKSADIEVTPGSKKSNLGILILAFE